MQKQVGLIITVLCIFLFVAKISAQNKKILTKPITVAFSQQTIRSILTELEITCNVHFTYNSDIIDESAVFSQSFFDEPLQDVLSAIFGDKFIFKVYGSQIVISEKKESEPTKSLPISVASTPIRKVEIVKEIVKVYDTVWVGVYDTTKVTILDTLKILDTTTVYQYITVDSIEKSKWTIDLLYSSLLYSFDMGSNNLPPFANKKNYAISPVRGTRLGVSAARNFNSYSIHLGGSITDLYDDFSISSSETWIDSTDWHYDSVSYWRYTVVDDYYKFIGNDSVLVSVYDSSYVTDLYKNYRKMVENHVQQHVNSFVYLEFPIGISYTFFQRKDKQIRAMLSVNPMFLLQYRAKMVDAEGNVVDIQNNDVRLIQCASTVACRYEQFITANTALFFQPAFEVMFVPRYTIDYPVHNQSASFSLSFGISMNF